VELFASLYAAVVATKVGTVVAGSRLHYNISAESKIGSVYLGSFSNDENENHYKSSSLTLSATDFDYDFVGTSGVGTIVMLSIGSFEYICSRCSPIPCTYIVYQ